MDFVQRTSFRFFQPDEVIPTELTFKILNRALPPREDWPNLDYIDYLKSLEEHCQKSNYAELPDLISSQFDLFNTVLPEHNLSKFSTLFQIQRMSTVAIASLINNVVKNLSTDHAYVNIGVWHGFSLLAAMIDNPNKLIIGVDNFSEYGGPRQEFLKQFRKHKSNRHHFNDIDYREYFRSQHNDQIGFYFYDGSHTYENQFESLLIAEPFFSYDCIVMVDDTNWDDPRRAVEKFLSERPGQYQKLFDVKTTCNGHPTFWNGLMVFQRTGR